MQKEKKGNLGLVIVLIVLLLCAVGLICFGYTKYEDLNKKYDEANEKLNNLNNDDNNQSNESNTTVATNPNENISNNDKNYTIENGANVYGKDYFAMVVGVNGDLFILESDGSKAIDSSCAKEIINGATFTGNKYSCKNSNVDAYKLNIKESDVYKVNVMHRITHKDPSYDVFIIYNDGSVKLTGHGLEIKNVFSNYKVKNVSENCASKDTAGECISASYTLTLQDGITKTITSLN